MQRLHWILALCVLWSCKPKSADDSNAGGAAPPPREEMQLEVAELPEELTTMLGERKPFQADPVDAQLAYAVPDGCKLGYEVDAEFTMGQGSDGKSPDGAERGMQIEQRFHLSAGGSAGLQIDWGEITLGHVTDGVARPGSTVKPGALAPTLLKFESDRLVEVDGPTAAWSAFGTFPGPSLFFGALPRTEVLWAPDIHAQGSGSAVEARRGTVDLKGNPPPAPMKLPMTGTATFVKWVEIEGVRAAHFSATWSAETSSTANPDMGQKVDSDSKVEATSHYLVSESGRLLLAHVESRAEAKMSADFMTEPLEQRIRLTGELRLTKNCADDDLTFPTPPTPPSPAERALAFLADHRNRLARGEWKAAAQDYAPTVTQTRGAEEVAATLQAHFTRFGFESFGAPEIATETRVKDGGDVMVTLTGFAKNYDERSERMSIHTQVRVTFVEGAPRILFARAATTKGGWNMSRYFSISDERVHSHVRPFAVEGQTEKEAAELLCSASSRCEITNRSLPAFDHCVRKDIKNPSAIEVLDFMKKNPKLNYADVLQSFTRRAGVQDCPVAPLLGDIVSIEDAFEKMCKTATSCPDEPDPLKRCLLKRIPESRELAVRFGGTLQDRVNEVLRMEASYKLLDREMPKCPIADRWRAATAAAPANEGDPPKLGVESMPKD